jgi:nucleoid-associated protein YgaU
MNLEKAIIKVEETGEKIEVMFNPSEYTVTAQVEIKEEKPYPFFSKLKLDDFTVKLHFDTYEKGTDVRVKTNQIAKLVMPTIAGKEKKKNPLCLFSWGTFIYKGLLYKITQKFTLFLPNGIPVRAEVDITFRALVTPEEYAKNMGMDACRKIWTVKSGDRLDLIANEALKDPTLWRKIAKENKIDNPRSFPEPCDIGRILIIPD